MTKNVPKINQAQRLAIESLLTVGSVSAAAKAANVSRQTVRRWMNNADFVAALKAAESQAIEQLSRGLAGLGKKALQALHDTIDAPNTPHTRLRAVEIVISNLMRLHELIDLENRISALEERNA